jgi:hypothetical protein
MAKDQRVGITGGGGGGRSYGKGASGKPYINRSANKPAATAEGRGFSKTKSGRAEMKTNDIAISRMAKEAKATGKNKGLADAAAPKSISARKKTVPVKKK